MDLKELMGDAYQEGMTKEDVQAYFKKQVLSGGDYVNTGKANAEKQELNSKIAELQRQLSNKMTDDEKKAKQDEDTQKLIKDLQKQLSESKASLSKRTAISSLAEAKVKAGIKDDDKDFEEFIGGISFEDNDKTEKISKYISKIVTDAYESGKSEAIKNKLGKMGAFKEGQDTGNGDEKGSFGKELAQSTKIELEGKKNFFERK